MSFFLKIVMLVLVVAASQAMLAGNWWAAAGTLLAALAIFAALVAYHGFRHLRRQKAAKETPEPTL